MRISMLKSLSVGLLSVLGTGAFAQSTIEQWLSLEGTKLSALTGPADYKGWTFVGEPSAKVDLQAIAEFTTEAKCGGSGKALLSQTFYRQPNTLPATEPRITRTISDGSTLVGLVLSAPRGANWPAAEWKRHGLDVGTTPLQKLTGQGQSGTEESPYYQWATKVAGKDVTCSVSGFGTSFTLGTITRDARLFGGYLPAPAPGLVVEWLKDQRRPDSPPSIDISLPSSVSLQDALAQLGLTAAMYEIQQREGYSEIRFKSGYLGTKRFPTYFTNQRGEREVFGEASFVMIVVTRGVRNELRLQTR